MFTWLRSGLRLKGTIFCFKGKCSNHTEVFYINCFCVWINTNMIWKVTLLYWLLWDVFAIYPGKISSFLIQPTLFHKSRSKCFSSLDGELNIFPSWLCCLYCLELDISHCMITNYFNSWYLTLLCCRIDCAGILKLRNSDIELRKGETDVGRKNTRVRLVFRTHLPLAPPVAPPGRVLALQVASLPIECCK